MDFAAWAEAHPILLILALVVATFGAGRLVRIIVHDSFPPAAWLRIQWDRITRDGPWSMLAHCHWCLTPWIMLICLGWGYLSNLHWTWWAFWGWLAISYIATMVVERDEREQPHE
jgi:hypothetical protein